MIPFLEFTTACAAGLCSAMIKRFTCSRPLAYLVFLAMFLADTVVAQQWRVERLNGGAPILNAEHFVQAGAPVSDSQNINGPAVIRVPDWIPPEHRAAPEAKYYLYFAHHHGQYLRLAWAQDIEGPWRLYHSDHDPGARGVLDLGSDHAINPGGDFAIRGHIASPDVHVDHAKRRIVLYFHGATSLRGKPLKEQLTFVATAPWGLDFSAQVDPLPLGHSYLRVFEYNGELHGLNRFDYSYPDKAGGTTVERATPNRTGYGVWRAHPARFLRFGRLEKQADKTAGAPKPRARHLGLHRRGNTLHVFFSMIGHSPERILATSVDLSRSDWFNTAPAERAEEVLRPQLAWEGAQLPADYSRKGAAVTLENALRDPFVFADEGRLYLFYAGGGEQAIGVARLTLDKP